MNESYSVSSSGNRKLGIVPEGKVDSNATCPNTNEYTHLRHLRTSGTRPPLVCVFPGPPGARDMAQLLPDDQPVYEFYWPNMDGRSNFPTVEQLAVTFVRELRRVQPHGPYQLCGYSTFGLVAYEMARLLLSQGENVSFLALFDIWHPRFYQSLTLKELVRYRIVRVADRLKKYRNILIDGGVHDFRDRALEFVNRKSKSIAWRTTRSFFLRASHPVPKAMQVIESIDTHRAYIPKPYPKRFVVIRTQDLIERAFNDQTVGWHVCATEGIDVHFVRGDHGTMMNKPYVRSLVDTILPYLN